MPSLRQQAKRRQLAPSTCTRDPAQVPNAKKCVFVHGMFVRVSGYSSATEVLPDFPE